MRDTTNNHTKREKVHQQTRERERMMKLTKKRRKKGHYIHAQKGKSVSPHCSVFSHLFFVQPSSSPPPPPPPPPPLFSLAPIAVCFTFPPPPPPLLLSASRLPLPLFRDIHSRSRHTLNSSSPSTTYITHPFLLQSSNPPPPPPPPQAASVVPASCASARPKRAIPSSIFSGGAVAKVARKDGSSCR